MSVIKVKERSGPREPKYIFLDEDGDLRIIAPGFINTDTGGFVPYDDLGARQGLTPVRIVSIDVEEI